MNNFDWEPSRLGIVMLETEWNVTEAARVIGCNPATLWTKLNYFGIKRPADFPANRGNTGKLKTHCKRGHAFHAKNVRLDKRGMRHCRTCQSIRQRANYADRLVNGPPIE